MKQNLFEILRRSPSDPASGVYASAAPRGLMLGSSSSDEAAFELAQAANFIGHLTRDVAVGGPSLTDRVFGRTSATPVGVEYPFVAGEEVTVVKADEIEVEGAALLLTSGTGAITTGTTVGTRLGVLNGKLREWQSGDLVALYVVTAVLTDAADLCDSDTNTFRIRAERI